MHRCSFPDTVLHFDLRFAAFPIDKPRGLAKLAKLQVKKVKSPGRNMNRSRRLAYSIIAKQKIPNVLREKTMTHENKWEWLIKFQLFECFTFLTFMLVPLRIETGVDIWARFQENGQDFRLILLALYLCKDPLQWSIHLDKLTKVLMEQPLTILYYSNWGRKTPRSAFYISDLDK